MTHACSLNARQLGRSTSEKILRPAGLPGPVFVTELRQGLRANQFVWPFVVIQGTAITCIGFEFANRDSGEPIGQFMFYGLMGQVVVLNLQFARAKLRLFEIYPKTSSATDVGILIMIAPMAAIHLLSQLPSLSLFAESTRQPEEKIKKLDTTLPNATTD